MRKIKVFFRNVYRCLNLYLLLGAIIISIGFYKVWPYLDGRPTPFVKGEGLVILGMFLLFLGMMKSISRGGYESSE